MKQPSFDIFTGTSKKNGTWLNTIEGLSNARARMHEIATKIPGQYFICSIGSDAILAEVETFKKAEGSLSVTRSRADSLNTPAETD